MSLIAEYFRRAERFTVDNSPLILTAVGVSGALATAVLSARAGYQTAYILDEKRASKEFYNRGVDPTPELTPKEKVEATWWLWIPPAGTAVLTCGAIIMANRISTRRAAALAAAYSLSERTLIEYRDKVREQIGDKKADKIHDDIQQDRVNRDFAESKIVIMEGSEQLCYDSLSGRFFNSTAEDIKWAMNKVNSQINNNGYASLGDFYDAIGLPGTAISEELGWNSDKLLDLIITSTVAPSGKAALAIDYRVMPVRNYFRMS